MSGTLLNALHVLIYLIFTTVIFTPILLMLINIAIVQVKKLSLKKIKQFAHCPLASEQDSKPRSMISRTHVPDLTTIL